MTLKGLNAVKQIVAGPVCICYLARATYVVQPVNGYRA